MKVQNVPLFLVTIVLTLIGCNDEFYNENEERSDQYLSDSFLPMSVGNYWKINEQNYTEIMDTVRIEGDLYYEFYSLTGGDASSTKYLRIDHDNNLIERIPANTEWRYVRAKFNAPAGHKFYTLNSETVNDYEVTVVSNNDDTVQFSFDMVYHPNFKGHPHMVSYKKGLGLIENWKEVKIDSTVYTY